MRAWDSGGEKLRSQTKRKSSTIMLIEQSEQSRAIMLIDATNAEVTAQCEDHDERIGARTAANDQETGPQPKLEMTHQLRICHGERSHGTKGK